MENQRKCQRWAVFLAMALALLLTACGGRDTAASMRLVKTDGTVRVDNAEGKSVKVTENLGLYSGYELTTRAESYGWINLDDTKLVKMDEESDVEIRKAKRQLELYVRSGNLFFNVTEPLEEDETFDIRTSTMAVGIRGTCGWVEVEDSSLMCVYLLRGKVECTVYDKAGNLLASETLTAGQAARLTLEGGSASITVAAFQTDKAPDFVADALNHPEDWPSSGNSASDTDERRPSSDDGNMSGGSASDAEQGTAGGNEQGNYGSSQAAPMTQDVEAALEQYRGIVSQADSYTYDSWLTEGSDYSYRYALVQMQSQHAVPALLLRKAPGSGMAADSILVFQYNPDTKSITQASGTINLSFRTDLYMAGDGNGALINYGDSRIDRISLSGASLNEETLWQSYGSEDTVPDWRTAIAIGHLSVYWYQIADTEGLNYWAPVTASNPGAEQGASAESGTGAEPGTDADQWSSALAQYRTIVSQADTYEYESWTPQHEYRYTLFQEEGYTVPTLILKSLDDDRTGFLLFRYDPETGTADQVGSDYVTRFEFPKHEFINGIPWDSWYDYKDSSALDAWEP